MNFLAALGVRGYAYLAIGLLILGLAGAVAYQYQEHKADVAQLAIKDGKIKSLADDLSDQAKETDAIRQRLSALDAQLKSLRDSQQQIQQQKDAIQGELDDLRKRLPQEDQACLARPLPPDLTSRLLGRPDSPDKDGSAQGAGKPPRPLPEVESSG